MTEKVELDEIKQNDVSAEPFAFLTSADEMEYMIIESLFKAYNIPCVKKDKEAGGYLSIYMGSNKFGVDVFVPKHLLGQAQELLESNMPIENAIDEITPDEETEEYSTMNTANKRHIAWVLLVIFGLPVVLMVVSVILQLFR